MDTMNRINNLRIRNIRQCLSTKEDVDERSIKLFEVTPIQLPKLKTELSEERQKASNLSDKLKSIN